MVRWFKGAKSENISLKVAAVVAFVVMVTSNALANIIPINGNNTGEVSDAYANLFAPIGFTFSIWGVIYALLAVFCIYQFKKFRTKKSKVSEKVLNNILPYFIASSILNSIWIFAWHYRQIGLSTLIIIAILGCLVKIVAVLSRENYTKRDYLFVRLPFSVYFGWLTVAVIANITTWLVAIDWNTWGFSQSFWTIVVLVIGALIGTITAEKNRDAVYLAVFVWAYFGILAKHLSSAGFNGQYEQIITVLVVILGLFVYKIYRLATFK